MLAATTYLFTIRVFSPTCAVNASSFQFDDDPDDSGGPKLEFPITEPQVRVACDKRVADGTPVQGAKKNTLSKDEAYHSGVEVWNREEED